MHAPYNFIEMLWRMLHICYQWIPCCFPPRSWPESKAIATLANYYLSLPLLRRALLWFLLIVMVLLLRVAIVICFGCSIFFINNSVTFDKLGAVNGLAVSLTDGFR